MGHYFCDPETGNTTCYPGWADVSSNCTIPTDECDNVDCQNGGTCVDAHLNFTCVCPDAYFGDRCQFNVCDNITCNNSGQCVGFGECSCQQGFSGNFCEIAPQKQDPESTMVPFWAAIVLFCLLAIILVDVVLVSCYRYRRSPEAMKQPLVQQNATYDANLAIDNFQHINSSGESPQHVYTLDEEGHNDPPVDLLDQQPKFVDGAYPGDANMWGSSPPSSPLDTSDTKAFAFDLDEESKDNMTNTRRSVD
ncbi:hypothetical protein CAPTEDRAFT_218900 [Capitella teleta]|uniref:EGF-like domain-containing protein n=1 Tax=Capitella teleta TaxID=283909 RepID=R7VCZ5_CAPTE|nr:hypothetical protein CAPTEDRAFT_218900 [Capitella teleta]|eukprot:ELU16519.1 hypothetical protein CAPTEDRAFT_218900 [Capitella teleta]